MLSMMVEDINALFERLNFSEEEAIKVVSSKVKSLKIQGYEALAIGKIMSDERVNKNVMYRVLKSLWFTKEEVNFVELKEGVFLVEFGVIEDRARILNLSLWLFDQCLFAMLPYVKDQGLDSYAFNFMLFWVRIFNIPLEYMDRQVALDVGKAIGNVVAIGWQDNDRRWTEFIRRDEQNEQNLQYGNWLRAMVGGSSQPRGNWRNGVEVIEEKKDEQKETESVRLREGNESAIIKECEKAKNDEEESGSCSPFGKRHQRTTCE
ncbi:hypothetical protein PVK06_023045 [Gossypium arboreum]|uniref:DUF4283 domain-containing protein n=1 Tax=Gossypium arboreum TaxID=29729 RepID=A0ABR0PAC8_GOSAR|nr:hypothetical protein PVK06_023045 [Gossypium arboreum]